jgi:hypothetical protein
MSSFDPLGLHTPRLQLQPRGGTEHLHTQRTLQRVLAFLGHSIDEVCNDVIVKNKVYGFYKLHKDIERTSEITDLERQWNPLSVRY